MNYNIQNEFENTHKYTENGIWSDNTEESILLSCVVLVLIAGVGVGLIVWHFWI